MTDPEYKNINEQYEVNWGLISDLNIDEEIKEKLQEINNKLYNLGTTSLNVKKVVTIIIENISQNKIDIIVDLLIKLLKDYELYDKKPIFIGKNYHYIEKQELIVIKNFNLAKSDHSLKEVKKDVLGFNCFLIIAKEDKYPQEFFTKADLNSRIVLRITGKDYTEEEILTNLKKELKSNNIKYNISDNEWQEIISKSLKYNECCLSNCEEYLFKKAANTIVLNDLEVIDKNCYDIKKEEIKNPKVSLDDLIGLDNVKKEITSLKNYLSFQKRIGKKIENNYLNMLFLGSPGTGKTTVGRIYASILYELGYIKENKLIEIIPTDLMANYVGQTKDQTRKILEKAKGGVLFIDEAYLISNVTYSDGFASYMSEAVVELMKYMENPENVIIFAGYPIETRKIYDSNPGMKSRICKEIIFDDYTEEELLTILKKNLEKINFKINKKALAPLKQAIKKERNKKNFGNARFCNVLMQALLMNYANRITDNDTYEIIDKDIKLNEDQVFQIGFMED